MEAKNIEKELEVKILNEDYNRIEKKLIELGAKFLGKEIQKNILINSKLKPIEKNINGYLRIRLSETENTKIKKTLTLKQNIENSKKIRSNIEYNVDIDDENNLLLILEKLGYDDINIAYKERKSYIYENIRFDFDRWDKNTYPFPYMEIEVEKPEDLNEIIEVLNISRKNISNKSIKELQKELK